MIKTRRLNPDSCLIVAVLVALAVLVLFPATTVASSLRANTNWEEADPDAESKAVAVRPPSEMHPSKIPHIQRRLDINTINSILASLLPKINSALQAAIPEPLTLNSGGSTGLGCGSLSAFYNIGSLGGLSSINIDSLVVVPGTDNTQASSCQSLWDASVNTVISFGKALTGDMTVGLQGSCGTSFSNQLGGTAASDGTSMAGVASLKGAIQACSNSIDWADIANALALDFNSVSVSINGWPSSINNLLGRTTSQLSQLYKTQIIQEVEPIVRGAVVQALPQNSGALMSGANFAAWSSIQRKRFNGGILGKWLGTEGHD